MKENIFNSDNSDLSEYEKIRLENIKKNELFLSSLGLTNNKSILTSNNDSFSHLSRRISKKTKQDEKLSEVVDVENRRFSKRLRSISPDNVDDEKQDNKKEQQEKEININQEKLSYENFPFESNDLDDFEFQIYGKLRSWRLMKCHDLDIEAYKVFQNRTLCELIRRRRNNSDWALSLGSSSKLSEDLIECFGIGPSKAYNDGFGVEVMQFIDNNNDILQFFQKSRDLQPLLKNDPN